MFKIFRTFLLILFLVSATTAVYSEKSWITKKSDKTKVELKKEKKEKKEKKKEWIAKKKKNKKQFKDKAKNISKEVKSWITKKSKKNKYIKNINELPKAEIYFVARNELGGVYFGYINPKKTSQKISSADGKVKLKKNNIGFAYLNDGKTICNVATEIEAIVKIGRYFGEVHAECTNKTNFNGDFSQRGTTGNGTLSDDDGNQVFFNFYQNIEIASKNYDKFSKRPTRIARIVPPKNGTEGYEPTGKYYALIIANYKYDNKDDWADLTSPKHDAKAIKKVFDNKYKFTKTWLIENPTRNQIYEEFEKLKSIVTSNDYLLIYYSGHGKTDIAKKAYWIPKEGTNKYYTWVNVDSLTNTLEFIKARDILIMIDSCYSGLSFKKGNKNEIVSDLSNSPEVIETASIMYSRKVLTSGTGNKRVNDNYQNQKHSLFAIGFLKYLNENEGNLLAQSMHQKIKNLHVKKKVNQIPGYGTIEYLSLNEEKGGDFVFHIPKINR